MPAPHFKSVQERAVNQVNKNLDPDLTQAGNLFVMVGGKYIPAKLTTEDWVFTVDGEEITKKVVVIE